MGLGPLSIPSLVPAQVHGYLAVVVAAVMLWRSLFSLALASKARGMLPLFHVAGIQIAALSFDGEDGKRGGEVAVDDSVVKWVAVLSPHLGTEMLFQAPPGRPLEANFIEWVAISL